MRVGFGEEVADEPVEAGAVLDLRPVAAAAEDVELGARQQAEEAVRGLERDHLVLAALDDQGVVGHRADRLVVAGQGVDPALARGREHGGEGLLEAGAHAGLVAQLGQLVGDQRAVEGEDVEQAAHVGDRGRVAPGGVEAVGDGERGADRAHQHQLVDPLGVADGQRQGERAAERVAEEVHPLEPERDSPRAAKSALPGSFCIVYLSRRALQQQIHALVFNLPKAKPLVQAQRPVEALDMNGDGQINDLIYIPTAANAAQFTAFTVGTGATAKTFTPEQQAAAFDAFIENNEYLKSRRGQYAERNGVFAPWLTRMDFTVTQDFYMKMANGKKNTLQFRMDVYNFGNLLNQNSGVGWAATTVQPLTLASVSAAGVPSYRLATQVINGSTELLRDSFIKGNSLSDTYQIQLGVRYIFD